MPYTAISPLSQTHSPQQDRSKAFMHPSLWYPLTLTNRKNDINNYNTYYHRTILLHVIVRKNCEKELCCESESKYIFFK